MTNEVEPVADRERVFETLREIVAEWRAAGRKTTTAGITSVLVSRHLLDTEALGFSSHQDFWEAAERAGVARRERLPNGHWFVLLPGEDLPNDVLTPNPPVRGRASLGERRLPPDLWAALVEWDSRYRRFWDRENRRAFFVPSAPGWVPTDLDESLYAEIQPVTREIQLDWMREFAAQQSGSVGEALTTALSVDAPIGAFRRALESEGLLDSWRRKLRDRVFDRATSWAESHNVSITWMVERDHPVRDLSQRRRVTGADDAPTSASAVTAAQSTVAAESVRRLVLRAVESMAIDELYSLPLRAHHFLDI